MIATGLTVSSLLVAEGSLARVLTLVSEEFCDGSAATGRFVVHILGADDRALSDRFSTRRWSAGESPLG